MEKTTSIVICHWTGNLIYRCLKSLENVNAQKIVLSSNMSFKTDQAEVFYLRCNEPAYKRNWGARIIAEGKYLCFLDDDIELDNNCIQTMSSYLDLDIFYDVGMIYTMLYKMNNHNIVDTSGSFLSWNGFLYETYEERYGSIPILSGKSACCMIKRDIFNKIGGFDEDYCIYGEETDLSWRVWQAGYKVIILPSAIGYHAFETPLKPKSYYNPYYIHYHGCKNYITTLIKNLPSHRLYMVLLNTLCWAIVGIIMLFKNKQAGKWILQGIWYNVRNIRYIWMKRQEIQRNADHSYWKMIYKNPPLNYYFERFLGYLTHSLHGGILK